MADTETLAPATEAPARKRGAKAGKAGNKARAAGAAKGKAAKGKVAKGKAAVAKPDTSTLAGKRKVKRQRLADANKVTVILETEVREFIATEAKALEMDVAPFMQKMVETYVLANAPADHPLAKRLQAKRAVLDHIVALARQVDTEGGFDENFILNVMRRAWADEEFQSLYTTALEADPTDEKAMARAKAPLNQQIGRLIKRASGAKSKRDNNGKILRGQVTNEVITTYTLLEKPVMAAAA